MARGRKPGSKSTIGIWRGSVGDQTIEINADSRCYHLITPSVTRYFSTVRELMNCLARDTVRRKALGKPTLRSMAQLEEKFTEIAEEIGSAFDSKMKLLQETHGADE